MIIFNVKDTRSKLKISEENLEIFDGRNYFAGNAYPKCKFRLMDATLLKVINIKYFFY